MVGLDAPASGYLLTGLRAWLRGAGHLEADDARQRVTISMRRAATAAAACVAWLLLAAPAGAQSASDPPPDLDQLLTCTPYQPSGDQICSGEVPSFDGSPLDVDLTLPRGDAPPKGLMVMLHGFGADKHYWEANDDEADGGDRYHWNNHWFARHGYYVLTYTARGFATEPAEGDRPQTPFSPNGSASEPNGDIQLKSRDFEIRDTQWLSALVAAANPNLPRDRIAVTGNSYGSGESWLLAGQARWTFPYRATGGQLPKLALQVSVPKYGWTDLGYSLAPHGHPSGEPGGDIYESSLGRPASQTGDGYPVGTLKSSYTEFFYLTGLQQPFQFEEGNREQQYTTEGPINIDAWHARVQEDPYDVAGAEDPLIREIRRGLTEFRSSYYQEEGWAQQDEGRKVAIFAIQGWNDDLFPAVEAFRQFKYLKRLDPRWPVEVAMGDIGHPRAQNRTAQWRRLNQQAFGWLQANITGSHEQETTVSSQPTECVEDEPEQNQDRAMELTGRTPEQLSSGAVVVEFARGDQQTAASGAGDPDSVSTDAITSEAVEGAIGGECQVSVAPEFPGRYTAVSEPLPSTQTYVGLGEVRVPYRLAGTTATLNARIWDVPPDGEGPTLLVDRGTYRISVPAYDKPAGTLRLPLYGNHWQLEPGHRIRLDLAQVDAPSYKPSTAGGNISFDPPTLRLPKRSAGSVTLSGQ
jgi:hypothetical protein